MSQIVETVDPPEAVEPPVAEKDWSQPRVRTALPSAQEYEQFDYRPMPLLAPIAAVLAVCSLIAYLGLFGIGLAIIGTFVGLLAVWVIRRSEGALSGMWLALAGLLLCATNAAAGIGLQVYHYKHEVPEGYTRVNFTQEISKRGFEVRDGVQRVPEAVEALAGKQIFLKGFMYPTGRTEGLPGFLLLKDSGQCCFGGKPALQDMIGVRMVPGKEVDYYAGRVAVAGTFEINEEYRGGELEPIYILVAEHFTKAKTSF